MYAIDKDNKLIRLSDGAAILSLPDGAAAYSSYLDWLAAGNTPLPYEPPVDLRPAAQAALDKSDKTMLRCYEAGVAVPAEWATYRGQLRNIVSGTSAATELPVRPAYPVGS